MNELEKLLEHAFTVAALDEGGAYIGDMGAKVALAEILDLRARVAAAIKEMSRYARLVGEAEGRLQASEMAGMVDEWRNARDVAITERDLARALLREALAKCQAAAAIHSQYPIVTEYDRGYAQGRRDAAEAVATLRNGMAIAKRDIWSVDSAESRIHARERIDAALKDAPDA